MPQKKYIQEKKVIGYNFNGKPIRNISSKIEKGMKFINELLIDDLQLDFDLFKDVYYFNLKKKTTCFSN
ncbi:hypothetical protein BpHYR1_021408 [Brachionus plicatilis]|uniref:Uncharacterized protein n=1 Tax=Brachionus plicatilis TaxID=10195 RepID=A0A3M7PZY5_BRAPC|nr:hypothetical protein BpHYR1_021408 [Brachionus plicatilis]